MLRIIEQNTAAFCHDINAVKIIAVIVEAPLRPKLAVEYVAYADIYIINQICKKCEITIKHFYHPNLLYFKPAAKSIYKREKVQIFKE